MGVLILALALRAVIQARDLRGAEVIATVLRWAALALVIAEAAMATPRLLTENNPTWFVVLVVAVPVALAGLPLLSRNARTRITASWICAGLLLVLAALLGLGSGGYMLPSGLALLLAAAISGPNVDIAKSSDQQE